MLKDWVGTSDHILLFDEPDLAVTAVKAVFMSACDPVTVRRDDACAFRQRIGKQRLPGHAVVLGDKGLPVHRE